MSYDPVEEVLGIIQMQLPPYFRQHISRRTLIDMSIELGYVHTVWRLKALGVTLELTNRGRKVLEEEEAKRK